MLWYYKYFPVEDIRLRAIQDADWEGYHINRFDRPARRLLDRTVELPPTIAEAENFVETYADFSTDNRRIMLTIENRNAENIVGVNLNSIDEKNGTFSIGIQIDRDHRGKGYGTRAMRILLKYAF